MCRNHGEEGSHSLKIGEEGNTYCGESREQFGRLGTFHARGVPKLSTSRSVRKRERERTETEGWPKSAGHYGRYARDNCWNGKEPARQNRGRHAHWTLPVETRNGRTQQRTVENQQWMHVKTEGVTEQSSLSPVGNALETSYFAGRASRTKHSGS